MSDSQKRWIMGLVYVLLAGATLAAYWPVRNNGFIVLDDSEYVAQNAEVKSGLTLHGLRWAFTETHGNWHPITWLSHMLDCQLFGLNPAAHHFVGVAIHIANSLLLLLLLARLTKAFWPSAFVAAIFALHPVHVESVAWVAERKDVLSTFFGLLSLYAYVEYVRRQDRAKQPSFLLSIFLFALALMSKPMLITLPFLLLLLDYWPLGRISFDGSRATEQIRRLVLEKWPFFLLCAGSAVITIFAQHEGHAVASLQTVTLHDRLINALVSYLAYLGKFFWPAHLAIFYPMPKEPPYARAALSAVLLVVITVLAFKWRRTRPWFIVGWLWYLGSLIPVIGLVQVGGQAMADRYAYLPSIGLLLMITWLAVEVWQRRKSPAPMLSVAGLAIVGCCAALTFQQTERWRDTKTLFTHAARVTTDNYFAYDVLGENALLRGKPEEALPDFDTAIQIAPFYSQAWFGKGLALRALGRKEDALACFRRALEINPNNALALDGYAMALLKEKDLKDAESLLRRAIELQPRFADAQTHLAMVLYQEKDFDAAAEQYTKALSLDPDSAEARAGLGFVLLERGQFDAAAQHFETVLRSSPTNSSALDGLGYSLAARNQPDAAESNFKKAIALSPTNSHIHFHYALLLEQQKRIPEAIAQYRETVRYAPDDPVARNNLAWLIATDPDPKLRNGAEAVENAKRGCELTSEREPIFIGTLAAAYAEAGQFDKAIETAEKARSLAESLGMKEVAKKNEELLALYREHKAFRRER